MTETGTPGGDWLVDFVVVVGGGPESMFSGPTSFNAGSSQWKIATADFNGDGKPDLATANGNGSVGILLGNGSGGFAKVTRVSFGQRVSHRHCRRRLQCRRQGETWSSQRGNNTVVVLLGNGNGAFAAARAFDCGGDEPYDVVAADFNSDGNLDVAVANFKAIRGLPLGRRPGQPLRPKQLRSRWLLSLRLAAGDFNGDGRMDLAAANADGILGILLGGSGGFSGPTMFSTGGYSCIYLAVADFNNDAKLDLAAGTFSNAVSVLLGHGDGTFGSPAAFDSGGDAPTQRRAVRLRR